MSKQMSIVEEADQAKPQANSEKQLKLGAYIMATLDYEQNFKLYSYRVISPETFVERFEEITQELIKIK